MTIDRFVDWLVFKGEGPNTSSYLYLVPVNMSVKSFNATRLNW